MKPIVIVAAYRRESSIYRLLESLRRAHYPDEGVLIVLSLDGGFSKEVLYICEDFQKKFEAGSVEIIKRNENLGLRRHILWCGDQSDRTGSVVVLEDDLVVDPQFYYYASKALLAYSDDEKVSGIALYSQEYNEYASLPFRPLGGNYSGYFMKVACSWGQAWTKTQWVNFKSWYAGKNKDHVNVIEELPVNVKNWPESSWKKYFSAFLIQNNSFFFYPYRSYCTNSSDPGGEHIADGTNIFQTNMAFSGRAPDSFVFPISSASDLIMYDSYMEPASGFVFDSLGISKIEVEIDIYGVKPISFLKNKKFAITTKKCEKFIDRFYLNMKPFEISLLYRESNLKGCPVYLVDTCDLADKKNDINITLAEYLATIELSTRKIIKPSVLKFFGRISKKFLKRWKNA